MAGNVSLRHDSVLLRALTNRYFLKSYRWPSDLHISSNLVLNGNCGDVYVFQISGVLTTGDYSRIQLVGGISAATIFWQIAGGMTTGSYSDFSGVVLSATTGILGTKATFTGMNYFSGCISCGLKQFSVAV